ncbi:GDSL-like lipase/acylhydrolase family protein [Pseudomonas sp. SJZ085]|uniref:SGNH/GDSL hydrolase family protein n=1 Tax=unclassified Pseudomonas TaxID=196821 RepID=UPI00119B82B2|nr:MULTISPECIES: GDSL-type esterase/lipase family protein [unclassified Pseudomonas]TWC18111.1 GDSL-like lipase/acylhydrolase family protein [Pseudomonas sp. SJZ074]TWC36083.1 GDSL-like lipase/acylhydrolase family protein [Pseudomonas sp. SJZ085]
MDYVDVVASYQMSRPVHVAFIGNSVSCGFYGDDWKHIRSILQSNGKIRDDQIESDIPQSAPTKLRAMLKARNPASTVANICGSGWDTNDHLGVATPSSSVTRQTNSVDQVLRLPRRPEVVFLPLQINDANHKLTVETYTRNTNKIIQALRGAGIQVVLVKENYAIIPGYKAFIDKVDEIARDWGVPVIDTYTPFGNAQWFLYDRTHPNGQGHNLIFSQYVKWFNFMTPPGRSDDQRSANSTSVGTSNF